MVLLSVPLWVYVLVLVVVAGVGFFVGPLAGVAVLLATVLALFLWVKWSNVWTACSTPRTKAMTIIRFCFEALWFSLPALAGNQFPGFAVWLMKKSGRSHWNIPVSERWLGQNKTWPAYGAAVIGAVATIQLQSLWGAGRYIDYSRHDLWLIGVLFGVGIVAGDHAKSFFKRNLAHIPAGERWWPYDQLDFVVGGLLATSLMLGFEVWLTAAVLVPVVLLLSPFVNGLGYKLGLRKVPY